MLIRRHLHVSLPVLRPRILPAIIGVTFRFVKEEHTPAAELVAVSTQNACTGKFTRNVAKQIIPLTLDDCEAMGEVLRSEN